MAKDIVRKGFDVQPVDENGKLKALVIRPTTRTARVSADGKVLSYGQTEYLENQSLEVPVDKLADLIRELADWPIWYAKGQDD